VARELVVRAGKLSPGDGGNDRDLAAKADRRNDLCEGRCLMSSAAAWLGRAVPPPTEPTSTLGIVTEKNIA